LECVRKNFKFEKHYNTQITTNDLENKPIVAVWDSDCAFESDYDWLTKAKNTYG
jgi:hypothetical protein